MFTFLCSHKHCSLFRKYWRRGLPKVGADPGLTCNYTGSVRPVNPITQGRHVPSHIVRPEDPWYHWGRDMPASSTRWTEKSAINVLKDEEVEGMRKVCSLARECLDIGLRAVSAGITTDTIDAIVHEAIIERNCYPSTLGYHGYPKSCCISVNEVVCHGIPDQRQLYEGDIGNIDVTCYNGYHGDVSETVIVGDCLDATAPALLETSYACLMAGIRQIRPGLPYSELGVIIDEVAQRNRFSVIRDYGGHGINQLFHDQPTIFYFADNKVSGVMEVGHVFTVEPMVNEGCWRCETLSDGWTVVTKDGKRSAQFEHTVVVTENGADILTTSARGKPYFMVQK